MQLAMIEQQQQQYSSKKLFFFVIIHSSSLSALYRSTLSLPAFMTMAMRICTHLQENIKTPQDHQAFLHMHSRLSVISAVDLIFFFFFFFFCFSCAPRSLWHEAFLSRQKNSLRSTLFMVSYISTAASQQRTSLAGLLSSTFLLLFCHLIESTFDIVFKRI